ncbi:hypothetical protein JYB88_02895 [Shewanella cyperi]|uniref:Uncharacterized protein n=1 Tax=Shewanella cyperi TaxID=2814292 RepID=A0A974XP29_9GAMM|nr:hypothetical protein [Shewanella cyperi]QSX30626.1 hypothetical protein JYB88_02895 [Shewanella cyperi]
MLPAPVLAYNPDTGHLPLARQALALFESCSGDSFYQSGLTDPNDSRANQLLIANHAMDKGATALPRPLLKLPEADALFTMARRVHNWHFFNPDKQDPALTQEGRTDMSMARLWYNATQGFERYGDDYRWYFLGALMHLTEDVSVPAHVAPVYHGPKLVAWKRAFAPLVDYLGWGFRGVLTIHDRIDDWPVSADLAQTQAGLCAVLATPITSADSIRLSQARATLAAMAEAVPGCPGLHWGDYWQQPLGHKYFVGYNQQLPPFGEERARRPGLIPACVPDKAAFDAFVKGRHLDAIRADLQLLQWARQSASGPLQPGVSAR